MADDVPIAVLPKYPVPEAVKEVVEAYVEVKVPEVELKRRDAESVRRPPVVAKGTLPEVRDESVTDEAVRGPNVVFPAVRLVVKKSVVVAEVPVALRKVKFWRVEEPVVKRLERVVKPPVALRVPVKLAADDMV